MLDEETKIKMNLASYAWLSEQVFAAKEMYFEICANFDGSEYQQGVKDGMRKVFALLGNPEYLDLIKNERQP